MFEFFAIANDLNFGMLFLFQVARLSHNVVAAYIERREAYLKNHPGDFEAADKHAAQGLPTCDPVKIHVKFGQAILLDGWTVHSGAEGEAGVEAIRLHVYLKWKSEKEYPPNSTYPANYLYGEPNEPTKHFASLFPLVWSCMGTTASRG